MRIAQVAPLYESVPPRLYGGTERVVSFLTEELVRLGHEVTLFASGDSETMATLVAPCERALWRDPACRETLAQHVRLMELVFRNASQFDVIHFHNDYLHFPLLRHNPTPTVTTLHGRLHLHDVEPLFREFAEVPLVSISDDQRPPLPDANWQATVHHGLPRETHTFQDEPGEYLVFVGRSRLKSDSTVQSRSRGARAESSRSPQKSMTRIGATITNRLSRCSGRPGRSWNSLERSVGARKTSYWATPAPFFFRLTGRNRLDLS